jgi:hypothetical protein
VKFINKRFDKFNSYSDYYYFIDKFKLMEATCTPWGGEDDLEQDGEWLNIHTCSIDFSGKCELYIAFPSYKPRKNGVNLLPNPQAIFLIKVVVQTKNLS